MFRTDQEFWGGLQETCKNSKPTVLWSGNGTHIRQPLEAIVMEQESQFAQFDQPSQMFLKFAALLFSNNKSDINNNPACPPA